MSVTFSFQQCSADHDECVDRNHLQDELSAMIGTLGRVYHYTAFISVPYLTSRGGSFSRVHEIGL